MRLVGVSVRGSHRGVQKQRFGWSSDHQGRGCIVSSEPLPTAVG